MAGRGPAPGLLEAVRSFINTYDVDLPEDSLTTPGDLVSWLAGHDLIDAEATATRRQLAAAMRIRDALRVLALANNGDENADVRSAWSALDEAAEAAAVMLRFSSEGPLLEPEKEGIEKALGTILVGVAEAMADGTWARLKVCRDDTCAWVFYDHSKNRSSTWCAMGVCGNRAKARAYRARQATSQT
ncbi:MAG TPA: CGNR zinc finger domain-containing protein [Actinomycetota bacterium]|nr:CGNR zinc finger domain-containing protein [Actinomycetota bacterium]